MMDKGVSVLVCSHDLALRPSVMRAVGSAIKADASWVTVYLGRHQSRQLLLDLAATDRIAVVFSEPRSHRTVQLKGRSVELRQAGAGDTPVLQRYLRSMEHEVGLVGFPPAFVHAMLAYRLEDLLAVSFSPTEAYDQSPGPEAGIALRLGAGHAAA